MARQTVGAISSREFTVSPTGCRNPLTEQRKLSRSPLLIRLRPSSLKFGMISPGLYFGSPLLITWQQSFAYGRIKQGFVELSLQLLHPECSDKTGISLLSKRRHWKSSDTFWTFNIYTGTFLVLLIDCDCKDVPAVTETGEVLPNTQVGFGTAQITGLRFVGRDCI